MTPFGKRSRELRRIKGMLLGDVTDALSVSPSYLSQIENGKRRVPDGLVDRLSQIMNLTDEEKLSLIAKAAISAPKFEVKLDKSADDLTREVAHQFSLGFARLTDEKKREMLRTLKGGNDD